MMAQYFKEGEKVKLDNAIAFFLNPPARVTAGPGYIAEIWDWKLTPEECAVLQYYVHRDRLNDYNNWFPEHCSPRKAVESFSRGEGLVCITERYVSLIWPHSNPSAFSFNLISETVNQRPEVIRNEIGNLLNYLLKQVDEIISDGAKMYPDSARRLQIDSYLSVRPL